MSHNRCLGLQLLEVEENHFSLYLKFEFLILGNDWMNICIEVFQKCTFRYLWIKCTVDVNNVYISVGVTEQMGTYPWVPFSSLN